MSSGRRLSAAGAPLALLALFLLAGCGKPLPPAPTAVVVLDIDTLRADGLGCYGNPRSTSPNIDRFATGAARFAWAFSQAPYTLPSQVSILTSRYPWVHGVWENDARLGASAVTVAERFRAAGWTTAAFVDGGFLKAHFGIDQGFDEFTDLDGGGLARGESLIRAWLEKHRSGKFFLFVHTYDAHAPYAPPEPMRSRFAALAPEHTPGFEPTSEALEAIRASQWKGPRITLNDADLRYSRAMYDGEVAFVDSWFGRFRDDLVSFGLAARTAVALVSDHGEEFQEHGSVLHEKLYATVTHVPLLIGISGGEGRSVDATVETVDLVPTLLDLVGLPDDPTLDGRSLAPFILGSGVPEPRTAYSMSPFYGVQFGAADDEWHLILTRGSGKTELYRYRTDAREEHDLSAAEPGTVRRLVAAIAEQRRKSGAANWSESTELTDDVRESLRALGYLR